MGEVKRYDEERDIEQLDILGGYYGRHVSAMTSEGLHRKSAIAAELGYRDSVIDALQSELNEAHSTIKQLLIELDAVKVPEGFALVPTCMELSATDIACIVYQCGADEDAYDIEDRYNGGVLWVGNTVGDDGELTHGLHIACFECLEEGSTTVVEFAPPHVSLTDEGKA